MKIRDLFVADVTRDIPPVVYFHEQSPEKLRAEVSEYIITGGFPASDPRARRVKDGIHEQFVRLLTNLVAERGKAGGPSLPASWISGYYGSGKSSFAKLLGLALNGDRLPDGTPLSEALLRCDDSPKRQELVDAWKAFAAVDAIAVVFDIGGVSRDGEQIHAAALRQVQARLGYARKSNLVADFEFRLERDGEWNQFLEVAKKTLGKDWSVASKEEQVEDHFSHVLHVMKPDRYPTPGTWIDDRAGVKLGAGTSATEVVERIEAMMSLRGEGKALFLVIDEVSQYVHDSETRMLGLQSFVSELGARLKGGAWLLATGQQKLEDQAGTTTLGKLKDRFPSSLRVHLAHTNIRDVVHKRLLRKKPEHEGQLRDLFARHRGDLKLYAYACEDITEQDFLDVYPMVPGQIELLMNITSNLRVRSSRVQGDSHAIRGLLQLLGELFRERKLADDDVGTLVTLDAIYEVQASALDADVQVTLSRLFADPRVRDDVTAVRAAKAVALLEQVNEQMPTTAELVAQSLYARLGDGNRLAEVTAALEMLRSAGLLSYSEKTGFKIQSSAGEEWQRERSDIGAPPEAWLPTVQAALKKIVGEAQERPRWKGRTFPWTLWFSDGRQAHDAKLQDARDDATVAVDFRFLARSEDRAPSVWTPKSDQDPFRNRLVWVVGDGSVDNAARELVRSERMVKNYSGKRETLSPEKLRLLGDEEYRSGELEKQLHAAVREAFVEGSVYFRGQQLRPKDFGASFNQALVGLAQRVLPDLYPYFSDIAVTPQELGQLLDKELSGPSTKFMDGQLGILSLDAGKYVAACSGTYPSRVLDEIGAQGRSGQALIAAFVEPPYGYPPDVVKACVAGLLRAKKIRIRVEKGDTITSYQDPGVRDLFTRDRDFRRAELFLAEEPEVTARDRVAIRKMFASFLGVEIESDDEQLADATFQYFPAQRDRLREIERRFDSLPARPELPPALKKLGRALEESCRSRLVNKTVVEVKNHLDALRDGFEALGVLASDLTPAAVESVRAAAAVRDHQLTQLEESGDLGALVDDATRLRALLAGDRPWRETAETTTLSDRLSARYIEVRRGILNQQNLALEAAKTRVKQRDGFAQLDADRAHKVLAAIHAAAIATTPEAVAPTLTVLRARFDAALGPAEDRAHHLLDAELGKETATQVVARDLRLRGREVATREELRGLVEEVEREIGALLDAGHRVRIV